MVSDAITLVSPDELIVDDVRPLEGFRIWVRLSNGVAGALDLTRIAESPWFQRWQDRSLFEDVRVSPDGRNIVWGGEDPEESDLIFCIIWLYVELTGQPWEEFVADAKGRLAYA